MKYSDQRSGENLSRGHYQTASRDFKRLKLPLTAKDTRKEKGVTVIAILMLAKQILGGEKHNHIKQRNK